MTKSRIISKFVLFMIKASANSVFAQLRADGSKFSILSLIIFSYGLTSSKPPAIFATLPVRWLSFRTNSNLVVLLVISNGRTSPKSLASQILFVNCNRDSRDDASTLF